MNDILGELTTTEGQAEFYIRNSYYELHMVKMKYQPTLHPSIFDAIAVFSVPTAEKQINTESGKGVMVEYSGDIGGFVHCTPGILARQSYSHLRNPYGQYNALNDGFYSCKLKFEELTFHGLPDYLCTAMLSMYSHETHNSHVYHRSLVATAIKGKAMYSHSPKTWLNGKVHSVLLRSDIRLDMLEAMALRQLVNKLPLTII